MGTNRDKLLIMRTYSLYRTLDLFRHKEGLQEYFKLLSEGARTHTDIAFPVRSQQPAQTREAALT